MESKTIGIGDMNLALLRVLESVIAIPDKVVSLSLTLEVGQIPKLEIKYYVNAQTDGKKRLTTITKQFSLVEMTEDVTAIGDESRRFQSAEQ